MNSFQSKYMYSSLPRSANWNRTKKIVATTTAAAARKNCISSNDSNSSNNKQVAGRNVLMLVSLMFCDLFTPFTICLCRCNCLCVCVRVFSCECFCVWYLVRLLLFFLLVSLYSFHFFLADFFPRLFCFVFSISLPVRVCVYKWICLFVWLFACVCVCVCMWEVFCYFHHRVGLMWFSFVVYYALFSLSMCHSLLDFFPIEWAEWILCYGLSVCVCAMQLAQTDQMWNFPENFLCAITLRRSERLLNKEWRCCKCFSVKSTCAPFGRCSFCVWWFYFARLLLLLLLDTKCTSVLEILLRLVRILHALAQSLHPVVFSIWSIQFSSCAIILTHFCISFVPCPFYVHSPTSIKPKFLSIFHIIESHG